jgi:hypothetical protein
MKNHFFSPAHIIWCFYLISFCNLLSRLNQFFFHDFQSTTTTATYLYQWIPDNIDLNFYLSLICPGLMMVLIFILPLLNLHFFRIIWFILAFLIEGFKFSYDIGHDSHIYVWLCLYFALIPGHLNTPDEEQKKIYPFIRFAQFQIILIYALSGFWKLIAVLESLKNSHITAGSNYISYAIASEFLYSNKNSDISRLISQNPALCLILSILVFLAQTGSIFILRFPQFYFYWGLVLAMFHVGTLITLNVFFIWSIPPILIFLCFYPMNNQTLLEPFCAQRKIKENHA